MAKTCNLGPYPIKQTSVWKNCWCVHDQFWLKNIYPDWHFIIVTPYKNKVGKFFALAAIGGHWWTLAVIGGTPPTDKFFPLAAIGAVGAWPSSAKVLAFSQALVSMIEILKRIKWNILPTAHHLQSFALNLKGKGAGLQRKGAFSPKTNQPLLKKK